ncbi:tetratricopeptide repeat protein [bacterium]|nr:MAG: tetratricopeptide repeat protein [bacterium]
MALPLDDMYQQGFQARANGDYGRARLFLESVLSQDPTHMNARHQLGLIQGFEGDFDGSLATLRALAAQYPNNLGIKYDYAMTAMMLGESDLGCQLLNEILAVDPTHDDALRQSIYC